MEIYTIPRNFRNVMLEAVEPGVPPEFKGTFEYDYLCNGQALQSNGAYVKYPMHFIVHIHITLL